VLVSSPEEQKTSVIKKAWWVALRPPAPSHTHTHTLWWVQQVTERLFFFLHIHKKQQHEFRSLVGKQEAGTIINATVLPHIPPPIIQKKRQITLITL